ELADLGLVTLAEDGQVGRTVFAWSDPERRQAGPAFGDVALPPWLHDRVADALAAGQHAVSPWRVDPPAMVSVPANGEEATVRVDSVLTLPRVARGKTLGTLTLAQAPAARPTKPEASLAVEVSGRAAVALDNSLLVREIRDNDERKNEFLAMLAHELRNPLAP